MATGSSHNAPGQPLSRPQFEIAPAWPATTPLGAFVIPMPDARVAWDAGRGIKDNTSYP